MLADELKLLRGEDYIVNPHIRISQPTLDEICAFGEQRYFDMVFRLCSAPTDFKVQLFDQFGMDYEEIDELEFFYLMCHDLPQGDTAILFGSLDLPSLKPAKNKQNGEFVLYDAIHDVVVDRTIYRLITDYLRTLHGLQKKVDRAGNPHTKKYLIDKERRQLQRRKSNTFQSILLPLISSMVNCEQFKYDHASVWKLPLFVFFDSVKRIQTYQTYQHLMQGVYAGTIDVSTLSAESLNWMGALHG